MIAGLVILAALLRQGRWRPWIRQTDRVHSPAVCLVLTWAVAIAIEFSRRSYHADYVEPCLAATRRQPPGKPRGYFRAAHSGYKAAEAEINVTTLQPRSSEVVADMRKP